MTQYKGDSQQDDQDDTWLRYPLENINHRDRNE